MKGLLLSSDVTASTPTAQVLIQGEVNASSVTPGEIPTVSLPTGTATTFSGFSSLSLSAVTAGQFVVAKGPLFSAASSGTPDLSAIQLATRTTGN